MKLFEMCVVYGNPLTIVTQLRERGLLRTSMRCDRCGERGKNVSDGLIYCCKKRSCRLEKSIRCGSFFKQTRLTLWDVMLFLHLWSKGYTKKLICDDFEFSKVTAVDWSRFCRDLCVYHFESDNTVIGGQGSIVEIDETLVVKRKYSPRHKLSLDFLWRKQLSK